jgi:membrane associated rhomboid family serine protease
MQSPFSNLTPVVKNLLIINLICFIPSLVYTHGFSTNADPVSFYFGLHYFNAPGFGAWQIITYMFLHGGWAHILFNMFALFSFGPILEYSIGSKKFFTLYFICGIGAALLQLLVQAYEVHSMTGGITVVNPTLDVNYYYQFGEHGQKMFDIYLGSTVGASGAIFGVVVAFAMLYPNMELMILFIPVPVKAKYVIPVYCLFELFMGVEQFGGDNVAHFAHIGGALLGFIMIKIWDLKSPTRYS